MDGVRKRRAVSSAAASHRTASSSRPGTARFQAAYSALCSSCEIPGTRILGTRWPEEPPINRSGLVHNVQGRTSFKSNSTRRGLRNRFCVPCHRSPSETHYFVQTPPSLHLGLVGWLPMHSVLQLLLPRLPSSSKPLLLLRKTRREKETVHDFGEQKAILAGVPTRG
jgi:hypothetical protein